MPHLLSYCVHPHGPPLLRGGVQVTGLNHGWDGDERPNHADFVHGGVPVSDFDDEPVYRSTRRKTSKNKRTRVCKKSKSGEKCDFSDTKVIGTTKKKDLRTDTWINVPRVIKVCTRCGKYDYSSYNWNLYW